MAHFLSWGKYPRNPQTGHFMDWPDELPTALAKRDRLQETTLPYGMGRSYGDSCLAASDHILLTTGMNRLLAVDWNSGLVRAQAGLSLAELIRITLPHGWFLPVTPGTKYVTLGGAVANDVHGKNHHLHGTFGLHVRSLMLYRSNEGFIQCAPQQRPELFAATVGGLGLTGVITEVELQLRKIESSQIEQNCIRFEGLDEFFDLCRQQDHANEYTVAWVDCLASGRHTGRGHYLTGNHAQDGALELATNHKLTFPINPPISLVNSFSLRAFNTLYYHRQLQKQVRSRVNYEPFFYPLDGLLHWNRIYGKKGFQQYQCVVPQAQGREVIGAVMAEIARSGTGSFLAVMKQCGLSRSPGLLSFPLHGVSLALDFPQHDAINERLFHRLDALVHEAGGRLYPAKDAHMSALHFKQAYPDWERVESLRDPKLLSRFWKRVTQ